MAARAQCDGGFVYIPGGKVLLHALQPLSEILKHLSPLIVYYSLEVLARS